MTFGFDTTADEIVEGFKDQVVGRTFLITGPTSGGIGAETALSLAKANPKHLILAGRSEEKARSLIQDIRQVHQDIRVSFIQIDLGSQRSVRAAAKDVETLLAGDKIDVLVLNAAIMACPFALTEDGIESQFATNHLGHFLFANLLLKDDLVRSRIVLVSSSASERNADDIFQGLKDITYDQGKTYDPVRAYALSKASNVLYARRLAKLLKEKNIVTFSVNPGSIKTNLQVYLTPEMREKAIAQAFEQNPDFKPPERKTLQQGAATQIRAALDPSLAPESGAYLDHCQISRLKLHEDARRFENEVWELSEKLVGERFHF